MRWVKASKGKEICVTNYFIVKNGDVVKRIRVIGNDYFCYNKTIDGKEYTIIEASVDSIFVGTGRDIVKLEPFRQYSDGSVIVEPDFITASLNPCTNETPPEEWNRTFGGEDDDIASSVRQTSDGGYIIAGRTESYIAGSDDFWLIKLGGIPAEPEGEDILTYGEPVQTPDMPGFSVVVAVMGLLVWVGLAERRR